MKYERVRRKWQNPFCLRQWNDFWRYVVIDSLLSLFDKSRPSLILYSADLCDRENVLQEAERIVANESLTIAERDDVEISLKEIKEGQAKKFSSVDEFLKELKE